MLIVAGIILAYFFFVNLIYLIESKFTDGSRRPFPSRYTRYGYAYVLYFSWRFPFIPMWLKAKIFRRKYAILKVTVDLLRVSADEIKVIGYDPYTDINILTERAEVLKDWIDYHEKNCAKKAGRKKLKEVTKSSKKEVSRRLKGQSGEISLAD